MTMDIPDTILRRTPPPSDIDEFERSGLLTCSPSLPGLCYPSPTPSSQEHPTPGSSDPLYLLPQLIMADSQPQDLHNMSFDPVVSDSSSFYPIPPTSTSTLSNYTTQSLPYAMYDQPQWYSYPEYSQSSHMHHYAASTSTQYPSVVDQVTPSLASVIPPTPQDVHPSPFHFQNTTSALTSQHHLSASPSFSQVSHHSPHSHRSSISSLSRSCSPSTSSFATTIKAQSGEPFALRNSLRSNSASSNTSLHAYGIPVHDASSSLSPSLALHMNSPPTSQPQAWRCAYPGCTSRATFTRGCDLRKHYNRHSKHLFCRVQGCPQSESAAAARAKSTDQPLTGGFSSKKDRARHEAKHNPGIRCEWRGADGEDCGRVFSRMDNMKDHVRRIHNKGQPQRAQQDQPTRRYSQSQGSSRK